MIGLIQRVTDARVEVSGQITGQIEKGILALIGVEKGDSQEQAERLIQKMLGYRIFEDEAGKMNLSLNNIQGGLLLVPQFTLPADTRKGTRPSFSSAAAPELGKALFHHALDYAKNQYESVEAGVFGADMKVSLCNDGPVTFWLKV
ncbi:D-aminoacyl-tRNA deacylase [Pleionea sp. CnH1-48]|uniref:D-aminoacyl-tRNA deacylase n=1 Tax=Pleionea sp. CnH1-48 TaxID=2954494 RepID=UPI002096A2DD|nr:D-aminoacyl-tRNA deacylase [Pleionea sp. CnH1-48]MCO7224694.1 D-aminoacyl-tRNA deacylase [Pleionea sp. CnH1-48]